MMPEERIIGGKRCYFSGDAEAAVLLVQPVGEHDRASQERETERIRALAPGRPFLQAAFLIEDWNRELSPWEAPPVFGNEAFGAGAADTLAWLEGELLPAVAGNRTVCLGGYSLAGFFSLWAGYQTRRFTGIAAVSPSVWFPGWDAYIQEHRCLAPDVYLSLGDREERTKNKTMARVGENIRLQHRLLAPESNCILEWNPGTHFTDPELRTAKGFAWLLNR